MSLAITPSLLLRVMDLVNQGAQPEEVGVGLTRYGWDAYHDFGAVFSADIMPITGEQIIAALGNDGALDEQVAERMCRPADGAARETYAVPNEHGKFVTPEGGVSWEVVVATYDEEDGAPTPSWETAYWINLATLTKIASRGDDPMMFYQNPWEIWRTPGGRYLFHVLWEEEGGVDEWVDVSIASAIATLAYLDDPGRLVGRSTTRQAIRLVQRINGVLDWPLDSSARVVDAVAATEILENYLHLVVRPKLKGRKRRQKIARQ
ncbi:hypothetical protein [Frankia sp. ACN1ag]|uniref:hypothetical protein n=1 Tax=Frankia sp. ACN1ag TaxID=102891 RepID=UPI0006DCC7D1|nr:hypothetical protein [Frankia sp. ACN1ag]KQC37866.1 hypothetical protein UK82_12720 [Frankia sp. ACN1ag]